MTNNSKNAIGNRKPVTVGPPATERSKGTTEMPTTLVTSPIAGNPSGTKRIPATTVKPATSNIKDESNIMTTHNIRNASNSRNESNNRTANTVWKS